MKEGGVEPAAWIEVSDNAIESSARLFAELPRHVSAVIGVGGGKALDVAKYVGFLGRLPPTRCRPRSRTTAFAVRNRVYDPGKRRSFPAALPFGVVIDTAVCQQAPRILTLSGVGDLVAKFTAVRDWKLAFH